MNEEQTRKAPRVMLEPDLKKIVAAISCVIAEGRRRGLILSQYDILKTLFVADKAHLNKFGRPVTFDNYCAMRAGPVPSLAYDILKETAAAMSKLHRADIRLPWKRSERTPDGRYHYEGGNEIPSDEILSQSDMTALGDALTVIKTLPFVELTKLLHSDKAYLEAWEADSERKSFPMSYGMLFEVPDFPAAQRMQFLSKTKY